jgi:uncharacterized membrane protein (DUF4010 family)
VSCLPRPVEFRSAPMVDIAIFERLALALALGLLIGLERGWHEREIPEGGRVAGIRTFGLIGLGGGLAVQVVGPGQPLALAVVFAGFASLLISAHLAVVRRSGDLGVTTMVAALLTFLLGAAAGAGEMAIAAALAVVIALLLSVKPTLHRLLQRIEYRELLAVLRLLLISVVLLPVLPDRGLGPWGALNPYQLWWMVVLITGISFCGYVAIRLVGAARGLMLTGMLGGLTSSTAVTLSFARLSRQGPAGSSLLAAGAVAASATMLPRILLIVGFLDIALAQRLLWPLGGAAVVAYGAAAWLWRASRDAAGTADIKIDNPFEFWLALRFGVLLAAIMLLSRAVPAWFGTNGLYALATFAGLGDVDAISLSMAQHSGGDIAPSIAAAAIAIAALANTVVKIALACLVGSRALAVRIAISLLAAMLAGAAAFAVTLPETSMAGISLGHAG